MEWWPMPEIPAQGTRSQEGQKLSSSPERPRVKELSEESGVPSVSGHAIAILIPHFRSKHSHFPDVGTWNPELRSDSRCIAA